MSDCLVIRARTLVSMAGEAPARGEQLFAPLRKLDDAALVLADGRVEEVVSWKRCSPPPGAEVRDLGDVCLAPAVVNAHCHVQLCIDTAGAAPEIYRHLIRFPMGQCSFHTLSRSHTHISSLSVYSPSTIT